MNRTLFVVLLTFLSFNSYAQEIKWNDLKLEEKMSRLNESIDSLKRSENHFLKSSILIDIVKNYVNHEKNDSVLHKMERILIGMSFASGQYFYHLYEHEFKEFYELNIYEIERSEFRKVKLAKVILSQSCRGKEIDQNFFREAYKLIDKNYFSHFDCGRIPSDISAPTYVAEMENLSQYFFEALTSCPQNAKPILDMRLYIIFSL